MTVLHFRHPKNEVMVEYDQQRMDEHRKDKKTNVDGVVASHRCVIIPVLGDQRVNKLDLARSCHHWLGT